MSRAFRIFFLTVALASVQARGAATTRPATNPRPFARLEMKAEAHNALFSADGKRLVAALADGRVCIWDVPSLKLLATVRQQATSAGLCPDGKSLVLTGDPMRLWDWAGDREIRRIEAGPTELLRGIDPAGRLADAGLGLYDLSTGKAALLPHGNGESYYGGQLSPDGRWFMAAQCPDHPEGSMSLWDVASQRELKRMHLVGKPLYLQFSPDSRLVAAHTQDLTAIWELDSGIIAAQIPLASDPFAWSADGRTLAFVTADGAVIWDLVERREVCKLEARPVGLVAFSFSADGRYLACAEPWGVSVWRCEDWRGMGGPPKNRPVPAGGLWDRISQHNGAGAAAIWDVAALGDEALDRIAPTARALGGFLREGVDAKRITSLIAQLDDDDFATREVASLAIESLAELAEPQLNGALKGSLPPEAKNRLTQLMGDLPKQRASRTPQQVLLLRCVAAAELVGSKAAAQLLDDLGRELGNTGFAPAIQSARDRVRRRS